MDLAHVSHPQSTTTANVSVFSDNACHSGNWTITLSVNFGMASLIAATISIRQPEFEVTSWQLLLIFYAILLVTFIICAFFNKYLPLVDIICAGWTAVSILIIMIALAGEGAVGRHDASYALGHYDKSLSGWGGFTFFIGLLPPAYTFSAIGSKCSAKEASWQATKILIAAM